MCSTHLLSRARGIFYDIEEPGISVGHLWAFEDVDGDGAFLRPTDGLDIAGQDRIFGVAEGLWILYVADAEAAIAHG